MKITDRKCDKCGTNLPMFSNNKYYRMLSTHRVDIHVWQKLDTYYICHNCYAQYLDEDFVDVRHQFLVNGNIELSNKTLLLFLGKLD